MRSLGVALFLAAVVLCSPCSTSRCSEQKQPAQAAPSSSSDPIDLTTIKSLMGEPIQVSTTEHFAIVHAEQLRSGRQTLERAYKQFYKRFPWRGLT
jgi:hypothetical protein